MSAFADAPCAGSAEAKYLNENGGDYNATMHPVQAAPRQSLDWEQYPGYDEDAPCAGSAEAKVCVSLAAVSRQDAPCAGSAEAKTGTLKHAKRAEAMHPVQAAPRQRRYHRAKPPDHPMHPVQAAPRQRDNIGQAAGQAARCTLCRQRRGKDVLTLSPKDGRADAPRAGSAEAKGWLRTYLGSLSKMHPAQAAPRQRQ